MTNLLRLVNPEWQGYGESPEVFHGARALAAALFHESYVVTVSVPERERLEAVDGVLGLTSIAARLSDALAMIRQESPERIVTIGGTCGTELAPIAYLNERYDGRLAVLWFDAHGDLNTPASSPSGHFHGMVLRTLLGEGPEALVAQIPRPLTALQVFLIGARDLDPPEAALIADTPIAHLGLEAFTTPDVLVGRVREAGFERVYVHFDLDVIDPDSLPAALLQVPGGPTPDQARDTLAAVGSTFDLAGVSVLEYCDRGPALEGQVVDLLRRAGVLGRYFPPVAGANRY